VTVEPSALLAGSRQREDLTARTLEELQAELGDIEGKIRFGEERGAESVFLIMLRQDARAVRAEIGRRNGNGGKDERAEAGGRTAITRRVSEIEREIVAWLWSGRIPRGKLTLVEGDPGLGKSWLTLAIAAAVSRGWPLPGEAEGREPASVILMNAEDGPSDTIRPRLEDMSADLQRVILLEAVREQDRERAVTLADLDVIEIAIAAHKPALVVVDPLVAYTAGRDTHVASEVRGLLAPLAVLAEKHRVAVLAVRHLTKANSAKAAYRGVGSIDFLAACRSAFLVAGHPEDPAERVLAHLKSNLAAKSPSLTFSLEAGRFTWGGETDLKAEQLLAPPVDGDDKTATDEATHWLKDMLSDGARPAREVQKEAGKAGISEKTVRRARERLGVKLSKAGFSGGWIWILPTPKMPHGAEDAPRCPPKEKGIFEGGGHLRGDETGWEEVV
jgi:putative DNA primase/helicase